MELRSILVTSGERVRAGLEPLLGGREDGGLDLIILLDRDARAIKSRLQGVCSVPILALTADAWSDEVLHEVRAEFIRAAPGARVLAEMASHAGRCAEADEASTAASPVEIIDGHRLIGRSPAIEEIRRSIQRIAATDSNVLITGETGTGKELIAELIQKNGRRAQARYICINCAAIPDSLLESELFGYERGAFTGAQTSGEGRLEYADGGTVFFDEIAEMSMYAQAKILRLIESKELQRLGAKRPMRVDFRVIAATNQDVESAQSAARFRRDLYFRLNVARIHVPPLRERKSDIPLLLEHNIQVFNRLFGRRVEGIVRESMWTLLDYDWPGNVRELKNMVEALFVNQPTGRETLLCLPEQMRRHIWGCAGAARCEQDRLLEALWATDWNKSKAARQLKWSRMTLYRKMDKYQLSRDGDKKPPHPAASALPPMVGRANG